LKRKNGAIILLSCLLSGCFYAHGIRPLPEPAACEPGRDARWCTGVASWYGKEFQGRKTSNGETYDMYGLSAAHRTLPLGTLIQVESIRNGKSVVVRVNDRGPFVAGRILDLSFGAASALDMVQPGTDRVKFRIVRLPAGEKPEIAIYTVQAAAFAAKANAVQFQARLEQQVKLPVKIVAFDSPRGTVFRVRVGQFASEGEAEVEARVIASDNPVFPFVLREDPLPGNSLQ